MERGASIASFIQTETRLNISSFLHELSSKNTSFMAVYTTDVNTITSESKRTYSDLLSKLKTAVNKAANAYLKSTIRNKELELGLTSKTKKKQILFNKNSLIITKLNMKKYTKI